VDDALLRILRCPRTGRPLRLETGALVAEGGAPRYDVTPSGIPRLVAEPLFAASRRQQDHYDRVAPSYAANLDAPHTREYTRYLDDALLAALGPEPLGRAAEICCGRGEALRLLGERIALGVGIDISLEMLEAARGDPSLSRFAFVQGDALRLPLVDGTLDAVVMLGGIHHVPDRSRLFREVARVLRPGGRLLFREPVDDLAVWRLLRAPIYRLSPALDHRTERPLRRAETTDSLRAAGLAPVSWETYGFLGFCLFMNSDVLVVNRGLARLPGIRTLTRWAARADEAVRRLPVLGGMGLQVVGSAVRVPVVPAQLRG
jgi:ubiquinone/menaquinone biosynthesis C-methylase UbiE